MFGAFLAVWAGAGVAAEVPLLRSAEDPRPQVVARVGEQEVLAVVDLAGAGTRVGWGTVYGASLKTRRTEGPRGERTWARIPELAVGDVVLRDIVAEVGGADDLVIGVSALTGVEVALLPSQGVVRVDGGGVLSAVGEPLVVDRQTDGAWWRDGERHFGDGTSLRIRAEQGVVGWRTDRRDTVLAAGAGPEHGGARTDRLAVTLGAWATVVEGRVDGSVADPDPDWIGALGADALYGVDLAVAPDRDAVAWSEAATVRWTDAWAWQAEHAVLDGEKATALWRLGDVEGALDASQAAVTEGDCLPSLVLGLRRQRAGADGVFGPLEYGMGQWQGWAALTGRERDRIRAGKPVDGVDATPQAETCAQATGRWLLARLADGEDPEIVAEDAAAYDDGRDPWIPLAEGVARLEAGDPARAEAALRRSWSRGGDRPAWLALAVALAELGREEPARALFDRLAWQDPQPLTTAWVQARVGLLPAPEQDGPERAGFVAREVVRTALAEAWGEALGAVGSVVVEPELEAAVQRARWRTADAAWTVAADHVLRLLKGEPEQEAVGRWQARSPEVWTARELVGDGEAAEQRRRRFPEVPGL